MKKIAKYGLPMLATFLIAFFLFGAGEKVETGYLQETTGGNMTDTITTAGDSADASYTFENVDRWKYLIVEYIQAAAPIKQLVLAEDNPENVKMTYDEADSTLKMWSYRKLGWVQCGFYAQVTSTFTETQTADNDTLTRSFTTTANDTVSGTTTKADTKSTTVVGTGAGLLDSIYTIAGTDTYALINDGSGTTAGTDVVDYGTTTTAITMTDPTKIIYEIVVTPDSGTKVCIFAVRGTNYLVGY